LKILSVFNQIVTANFIGKFTQFLTKILQSLTRRQA
jgi:hypothetical protein